MITRAPRGTPPSIFSLAAGSTGGSSGGSGRLGEARAEHEASSGGASERAPSAPPSFRGPSVSVPPPPPPPMAWEDPLVEADEPIGWGPLQRCADLVRVWALDVSAGSTPTAVGADPLGVATRAVSALAEDSSGGSEFGGCNGWPSHLVRAAICQLPPVEPQQPAMSEGGGGTEGGGKEAAQRGAVPLTLPSTPTATPAPPSDSGVSTPGVRPTRDDGAPSSYGQPPSREASRGEVAALAAELVAAERRAGGMATGMATPLPPPLDDHSGAISGALHGGGADGAGGGYDAGRAGLSDGSPSLFLSTSGAHPLGLGLGLGDDLGEEEDDDEELMVGIDDVSDLSADDDED